MIIAKYHQTQYSAFEILRKRNTLVSEHPPILVEGGGVDGAEARSITCLLPASSVFKKKTIEFPIVPSSA